MIQSNSVFFTGMASSNAEQLIRLFQIANKRAGNYWTLAESAENAQILVVDVDTVSGHMTSLRPLHKGQILVRLSTNACKENMHALQRPVTPTAIHRVLQKIGDTLSNIAVSPEGQAIPTDHVEAPEIISPRQPEAGHQGRETWNASSPSMWYLHPVQDQSLHSRGVRLIDRLKSCDLDQGSYVLKLAGLPPLFFEPAKNRFICTGALKSYLPHTQALLGPDSIQSIPAEEFQAQLAEGCEQPLERLLWLAALGASMGRAPQGCNAETRYRLTRWPQIERDFPRHFRIAATMIKSAGNVSEIAARSGATPSEIHEFIAAYHNSGHIRIKTPSTSFWSSPQKALLGLLHSAT